MPDKIILYAYPVVGASLGGSGPHYRVEDGKLFREMGHPKGMGWGTETCYQSGDYFYRSLGDQTFAKAYKSWFDEMMDHQGAVFVRRGDHLYTGSGHPDGEGHMHYELCERPEDKASRERKIRLEKEAKEKEERERKAQQEQDRKEREEQACKDRELRERQTSKSSAGIIAQQTYAQQQAPQLLHQPPAPVPMPPKHPPVPVVPPQQIAIEQPASSTVDLEELLRKHRMMQLQNKDWFDKTCERYNANKAAKAAKRAAEEEALRKAYEALSDDEKKAKHEADQRLLTGIGVLFIVVLLCAYLERAGILHR